MNILVLDQFRKNFWIAFETQSLLVEASDHENLRADLEAKFVAPLKFLGSFGKFEAKFANCINVHRL